jgi:hypothetical protein
MRGLRLFWAVLAVMVVMAGAASSAYAWQVTVTVHGAGAVTESTPRNLMNCTVSPDGRSNSSLTNCLAGTPSGVYASGDIVNLNASVPTGAASRGWAFVKWVDSSLSGKINCDPQGTTGDHFSPSCQFQIFENLSIDLIFVDSSGPQDTVITSSGPNSPTNQTSATFSFDAPSDPDATFECTLNQPGQAGNLFPCGNPADKSESLSGLTTNGQYTFFVRGKDPSGNVDLTQASRTWTIDTVPPFLTLSGGPPAGSTTNSTSATFGIGTNEGTLICRRDGAFIACTQPQVLGGLGNGPHTFMIQATDAAGNTSSLTRAWTVDTVAPVPTLSGGPPAGSVTNSTSATFTIGTNEGTVTCTLDGVAEPCTPPSETLASLSHAEHTFSITATDAAGNTSSASRTWTVDTVAPPPALIFIGPTGQQASTSASFSFVSSEGGVSYLCGLDSATPASCTSPKAYSALSQGPHTFHVSAVDPAGNVSAEATRSWTVDTVKPNTFLTAKPRAQTTSKTATFRFVSTEAGSKFQCKLDKGAWKACKSPKSYRGLKKGRHTFQVRAIDAAGNVDTTAAKKTWTIRQPVRRSNRFVLVGRVE